METTNNEQPTLKDKAKIYKLRFFTGKAKIYMLRFLAKADCFKRFMEHSNNGNAIAEFLGFSHICDNDERFEFCKTTLDSLSHKEKQGTLDSLLQEEKQGEVDFHKILTDNLRLLAQTLHLSDIDLAIFEIAITAKKAPMFNKFLSIIDEMYDDKHKSYQAIATMMDCEYDLVVASALSQNGNLRKMSLLNSEFNDGIKSILSIYDTAIIDELLTENNKLAEFCAILPCDESTLKRDDYAHIKGIDMLINYLKSTKSTLQKGVNILIYGVSDSDKAELAKVIAKNVGANLYQIRTSERQYGSNRINSYNLAQKVLDSSEDILLYDKAEDALSCEKGTFKNKALSVEMLQNNAVPTIWIVDNIHNVIDSSIVVKFKFSIDANKLNTSNNNSKLILDKVCGKRLNKDMLQLVKQSPNITPDIIYRANEISSAVEGDFSNNFIVVVNNILKAQGHNEIDEKELDKYKGYSINFINVDCDISNITDGLANNPNARICFYGLSGTGKSAFAQYIARTLGLPCLIKSASDLMDSEVGSTEKNIAKAFKEAMTKKAILVFDEVDSFLYDRQRFAKYTWESSAVNEMLVQMEKFSGIFIATTNLIDDIDRAALRRFDLKVEFKALKPAQSIELFKQECDMLGFEYESSIIDKITALINLTPGDFAAVKRQNNFMPLKNANDFYERLYSEVQVKKLNNTNLPNNIGFLNK